MFVDFNILNQLGSPSINSNTFANRPAAGQTGRLFVSTDTYEIYRDNGTTWDLIGGPGSSTVTGTGAATQVAYWTAAQAIGGSNNLWWDNTNGFLGVGTAAPTTRIEAVKTDGIGIYANFTTNAGSGSGTTGIYSINNTASSGYAAVIEERTANTTGGQYPLLVKHSLSAGTAAVGMGTGLQFQLPDDAGTFKTTQLTIETIDAAAATYKTRYRFNVQNNGSSTPVVYINSTGLGVFTATPSAALDIHSTGVIAVLNSTGSTNNGYLAFQRAGAGVWRIGDTYNAGNNFFELHNTVLGTDALEFEAATNKSTFQAQQTYTTGLARGNYFDFNLSVAAGGSFSSPNAITALTATLDLTLAGNATIPSGARSGLDAYNSISFTGTGTLTHNQGTQIRAYSNVTAGWAFGGSATGTITHLAGLRALFPDNTGSAVNVTNNYALLLNDQTPNTGTVTYTNRWGVYQEGASDLNYMAANLLLGSTTNSGERLQVTGTSKFTGSSFDFFTSSGLGSSGASGLMRVVTGGTGTGIAVGQANVARYSAIAANEYTIFSDDFFLRTNGAFPLSIGTNNTARITISSGGNIGTGVTPSAWGSGYLGFQVGAAGSQMAYSNNNFIGVNYYFDGTNYKAIQTGAASRIEFSGNAIEFKNAASVSAGSTQTFVSTAIIDASGKFGIGTNAPTTNLMVASASGPNFQLQRTGFAGYTYIEDDGTNSIYRSLGATIFQTNGANERARLTSGGNFLIGTTTDAGQKLQVNGNALIGAGGTISLTSGDIQYVSNAGYGILSANSSRVLSVFNGEIVIGGTIKTAAPNTGTAASWKLGSRVAATVVVNTTEYIEVDIGGTLYKLATVT